MPTAPTLRLIQGDALAELARLPGDSVHCVVTSPPYFGLRDYGTASWEGGDPACDHNQARRNHSGEKQERSAGTSRDPLSGMNCRKCGARRIDQQLGLEPTLDAYLARLAAVFAEVRRVLHPSGVCFIDIGDSYTSGDRATYRSGVSENKGYRVQDDMPRPKTPVGLKPKDRMLVPFRLALLLQADGWWIRDIICWHKPAPMPESVTDRCTQSWEPILMLAKSASYFWDAEAIKEKATRPEGPQATNPAKGAGNGDPLFRTREGLHLIGPSETRNCRNVWTIGPEPFTDSVTVAGKQVSHFASFPSALVRKCVLAATSARGVCPTCGEPWRRQLEKVKGINPAHRGSSFCDERDYATKHNLGNGERTAETRTIGWSPGCTCAAANPIPATVCDPFAGTGTTCAAALQLARNTIGIELSPAYLELARRRCHITPGLNLA